MDDDIVSSPLPPPPNPKKRPAPDGGTPGKKPLNLKASQFMMATPPVTDGSSNASPDCSANNDDTERAVSPAPSSSTGSSIVEITSSNAIAASSALPGSSTALGASSGPPPAKRRKLTPSEKLEKQRDKEAKEREKAEKKTRQEEEKARKDEEKRVKDEEKRKKAEEREAKKREKELEEERKAQEKLKKERSQMRLGAFFQKPAAPTNSSNTADDNENQPRARRRSLSLETYDDVASSIKRATSPAKGTPPPASVKKPVASKPTVSDYHRTFLPFELPQYTTVAPAREHSEAAQAVFDTEIKDPSLREQYDLGIVSSYSGHAEIQHYFGSERNVSRGIPYQAARDLVDMVQGTMLLNVIDLTDEDKPQTAMELLRDLPMKHIEFDSDVRPPYSGTYTKIRSPRTIRKLRFNPGVVRARPDTNYDDDSEADWEEPEEGDEEILSENGDDADSTADANDIDDFLDDEEDDTKNKRKMITSELVPESSGLCWANERGRITVIESIEVQKQPPEMQDMRMGLLIPGFTGTIDPFSTSYWEGSTSSFGFGPPAEEKGFMAPPRPPLQPRPNVNGSPSHDLVGAAVGEKGPITFVAALQASKRGPKPQSKTLNKEDLEEFKGAVVDSPLGKLELQKALKIRFPKLTNDAIKETLSSQFATVGKGKADKRWVFVGNA